MELHAGNMYWPATAPKFHHYPSLQHTIRKRVAIIGGGISGALLGYKLAKSGIDACLIERDEIAGGSSLANTGLLQYANDIMLHELMEQIGEQQAVRFYKACRHAIKQLRQIACELPRDTAFYRRSSLLYASHEQHVPRLEKEYRTLRLHGFEAEYWKAADIAARFPFRKHGAILSQGDAEVNPYLFVQSVIEQAVRHGLEVYEHTEATAHRSIRGLHRLETAAGPAIDAEIVAYANGYQPMRLQSKLIRAKLNRSFAAVTVPQRSLSAWRGLSMIWETANPYLYMRTTPDGRVIVGGLDESLRLPKHGAGEPGQRSGQLMNHLHGLFPMLDASAEYEWSAIFGVSRDNLPFIGMDPDWPGVFYSLGYGGNGTVYSMIAAELLLAALRRERHPVAEIVKLDRPSLLHMQP